jgi:SAM-dependent methyltransferase
MRTFRRFLSIRHLIDWKSLRAKVADCPLCGPTLLVRLARQEIAVRCLRCGASAVTMSIVSVIKAFVPDLDDKEVYEMSSRGPLLGFLKARCRQVTCSEYFDDVPAGEFRGEVQCQDVQRLTYPDGRFDLCTSTEVFEHVADDAKGFSEVRRVLKPRGLFIFTVPLSPADTTVERATIEHGQDARATGRIRHLLPPEYHGDWIRGVRRVLSFRDYGRDIVTRLLAAGFHTATIERVDGSAWWNCARPVLVAER